MGTIVMKESKDSDYYIGWSSIVEAPVWGGTRKGVLTRPGVTEERLLRADETGTSSQWVTAAGMRDFSPEEGSWEDDGTIYMQRGLVSRANMFVLTRRVLEDADADVTDLLTPFEDEAKVLPT